MRQEDAEKLLNEFDNDGEIRTFIKREVKRIERKYALLNSLLALFSLMLLVGSYFLFFKMGFLRDYIIVPIGLSVSFIALLFISISKLISGKPDADTLRVIKQIKDDSKKEAK